MDTGERIRSARNQRGITQKQLGKACGIDEANIRKYETGRQNPKLETLKKIADALEIPISDLIGIPIDEKAMESVMRDSKHAITFETDEHIGIRSRSALVRYRKDYLLYQENFERLKTAFQKLNEAGQQKAIDYISDLSELPKYQKDM